MNEKAAVHGNEDECTMKQTGGLDETASYSSGLRIHYSNRVPGKLIMICNCRKRRRNVVIERSEEEGEV